MITTELAALTFRNVGFAKNAINQVGLNHRDFLYQKDIALSDGKITTHNVYCGELELLEIIGMCCEIYNDFYGVFAKQDNYLGIRYAHDSHQGDFYGYGDRWIPQELSASLIFAGTIEAATVNGVLWQPKSGQLTDMYDRLTSLIEL